ncbi:hypothetical protein DEH84_06900 [Aquabacterium olei]|uniref:Uncharacterized protein n=1 Tax=Aquabacterium olei TaxID=1296669 RepID=A0A2U8FQN0_9BURK|nr:helix-turn-helix transcriptional regulator [Aquabacterium olei]AWI53187.1 hypothetical protein DEH84_06900 [Aquabacterium olei]
MDIHQIRLINYRNLLLQFANSPDEAARSDYGRIARFAAKAGVNPRYLSHINNGRKNLGDDLCREMERGLGLSHGWMDHNHELGPAPVDGDDAEERKFLATALELYRRSPVQVQQTLLDLALSLATRGDKA